MRWLLLALMMYPLFLMSQGDDLSGFSAKISVKNRTIFLSDYIYLELDLSFPVNYKPQWDVIRNNLFLFNSIEDPPPFRLIREKCMRKEEGKAQVVYVLDPMVVGEWSISFLQIPFVTVDGKEKIDLVSEVIPVKVEDKKDFATSYPTTAFPPLPLEKLGVFDVSLENQKEHKNIQKMKTRLSREYFREMTLILCIFFFVVLYIFLRKRKKIMTYFVTTKKAGIVLPKMDLYLDDEQRTKAYIAIVQVAKKILETYCAIKVSSMTEQQIGDKIYEQTLIPYEIRWYIHKILVQSRDVQFGKYVPTEKEYEEAYGVIKQLYKHSKMIT